MFYARSSLFMLKFNFNLIKFYKIIKNIKLIKLIIYNIYKMNIIN